MQVDTAFLEPWNPNNALICERRTGEPAADHVFFESPEITTAAVAAATGSAESAGESALHIALLPADKLLTLRAVLFEASRLIGVKLALALGPKSGGAHPKSGCPRPDVGPLLAHRVPRAPHWHPQAPSAEARMNRSSTCRMPRASP